MSNPQTQSIKDTTTCEHCGHEHRVSVEHEGKKAKCRKCRKPFVVSFENGIELIDDVPELAANDRHQDRLNRILQVSLWGYVAFSIAVLILHLATGSIARIGLWAVLFASFAKTLFVLAIVLAYLAPLLIAWCRVHRHALPLAIVNVAFGWTLVGWIGTLAWASWPQKS